MHTKCIHTLGSPTVRDAPIKQPADNPDSNSEEEITLLYLDFYLFYQSNLNASWREEACDVKLPI